MSANRNCFRFSILLVIIFFIILSSCQPEVSEKQRKALEDSITNYKSSKTDILKKQNAKEDSLGNCKNQKTDSSSYFDRYYKSEIRSYFDKNGVEWESKEKNEFRLVYKKDIDRLIVYKNQNEFKTYQHPKIFFDEKGSPQISVDGKTILSTVFMDGMYAPNGFKKHSESYGMVQIKNVLILNNSLNEFNSNKSSNR